MPLLSWIQYTNCNVTIMLSCHKLINVATRPNRHFTVMDYNEYTFKACIHADVLCRVTTVETVITKYQWHKPLAATLLSAMGFKWCAARVHYKTIILFTPSGQGGPVTILGYSSPSWPEVAASLETASAWEESRAHVFTASGGSCSTVHSALASRVAAAAPSCHCTTGWWRCTI